jgi:8-oxo-dGTP pyrophosphatase MutT (NUDIX family)
MTELTEDYVARKLNEAEHLTDTDGYSEIDPSSDSDFRCAAVLIPLASFENEWHVLYTRRTDRVESHKGQVSFPGGACDDGETTPEQTALREADEEIGIKPNDVRVLGRLSRMITITNYRVSPVVGVIPWPYAFKVANIEVARVFTMPLLWLANRKNYWEFFRRDDDRSVILYHPYDGELLWGATARMTVNFLKTIDVLE